MSFQDQAKCCNLIQLLGFGRTYGPIWRSNITIMGVHCLSKKAIQPWQLEEVLVVIEKAVKLLSFSFYQRMEIWKKGEITLRGLLNGINFQTLTILMPTLLLWRLLKDFSTLVIFLLIHILNFSYILTNLHLTHNIAGSYWVHSIFHFSVFGQCHF